MKISTEIASAAKIVGEEKAVELIAKAGFDAWDFSMFDMCRYDWGNRCLLENNHPLAGSDYLAFARRLKQTGLDNGIVCNQSHAPFPTCCAEIRSYYKRAIECTAEAGGNICIIHPDNNKGALENAEMYFELLDFAKGCGVKIATENMWNWDDEKDQAAPAACSDPESFNAHLDAVNDEFFVACLDIGHACLTGNKIGEFIRQLGDRLTALHIHDNDGLEDLHMVPYSYLYRDKRHVIDWEDIVCALGDIGFCGALSFEICTAGRVYPAEVRREVYCLTSAIGRYWRGLLTE